MAVAEARKETLSGWRGARAEVWRHIDADTILVGHSLQNDLDALRMIHTRVADSAILAGNAVGPGSTRRWGLKGLCHEFLGILVQTGKAGHDCLEDALAAREVVLWCAQNTVKLADWGRIEADEERRKRELQKWRKKRTATRSAKAKVATEGEKQGKPAVETILYGESGLNSGDGTSESEILHWSDIAEDLGWPHPDTGYDPWSD